MEREIRIVSTKYGDIRVKVAKKEIYLSMLRSMKIVN